MEPAHHVADRFLDQPVPAVHLLQQARAPAHEIARIPVADGLDLGGLREKSRARARLDERHASPSIPLWRPRLLGDRRRRQRREAGAFAPLPTNLQGNAVLQRLILPLPAHGTLRIVSRCPVIALVAGEKYHAAGDEQLAVVAGDVRLWIDLGERLRLDAAVYLARVEAIQRWHEVEDQQE